MNWQERFYFKVKEVLSYRARYGTQWSWDPTWDPGGERPGNGLVDQGKVRRGKFGFGNESRQGTIRYCLSLEGTVKGVW
jgi:hypothetical protein